MTLRTGQTRKPTLLKMASKGLTEKQKKLASYWNTPFKKLCLGMKVNDVTKWIKVHYEAILLYDEIANGNFKPTTAGSSMQQNCNSEGFNFNDVYTVGTGYMKVHIGFVANNEYDCNTPDSCIGFGISARTYDGVVQSTSCGNLRYCCEDRRDTAAYGFVLLK